MSRLSILVATVAAAIIASSHGIALAAKVEPSLLGPRAESQLKNARAAGQSSVTVLIAAQPGANSQVASGLVSLGATVRFREDSISYLRARVPVDRVEAAARLPGVQRLDLDEAVPLPDPRPEGIAPLINQPAPSSATPRINPYLPIGDTGAAQFIAAHPAWDGRGVTIGIIDAGVTLDHPSLLTTSTGERKIIDWVTYTDPIDDDDPTWLDMSTQVGGATFAFNGVTYTAPYKGNFRIAVFNERDPRLGGDVGRDVNRDGNPTGSSGEFAVLWDQSKDTVWVDTNQNHSFADEKAMRDYKINYDVNYFGTDNPTTPIAERMPFVIQTDGKNKFVNVGIVSSAHASHVAGIAAGNALFGGAMSGAAPGAKIVSVRACLFVGGCTAHALIEGMIYLTKQSNVDVINMSIGGLPALNDGNNTRAILYNRLIEQYNVQMFISAGNDGPGTNTISDPSVATQVMSIGSYLSKDTLLADYGTETKWTDNVHYFTSRGPREDGGFKPQVVAPGAAISTTPMWLAGVGLPYTLPPGYQLMNGTSMASPQAAGAAALLVSAAKQAGVQKQPAQIRQAINSSARLLDGPIPSRIPVYAQGNGIINVGAAWDLLRTNIKVAEISGTVPVHTVISQFLATPDVGTGIYDREGVAAGTTYTRTYTFIRTSGGAKPVTYTATWVGNDGTFSAPAALSLPLNTPTTFPVTINAATAGAHAAILNLDDPATGGIDYQTMNVVMATNAFGAGNNYSIVNVGTIDRVQQKSYFFSVPANVPALKVDFSGPSAAAGTGQARFLRWHPYGLAIDSNAVSNCYQPPASAGCATGSPLSRTTSSPLAGVWEVTVDARRSSDADDAPFTLTTSILGASVSPNPDLITSATLGVPIARTYTVTNLYGAFTGRAVGTTLGSAGRTTPTIVQGAQQQYPVTVTAGSTSLRATIGSPSDPGADLDLYVYNCTSGPCVLAGQSADGDSEESVTIANPAAGLWVILVDGFAVPSGSTTYDYIDVFVNAAFGSVSITDANALRPASSSWTVPGAVVANSAPVTGRVLFGNVQVRTDTNILVGSGDVVIQAVTP